MRTKICSLLIALWVACAVPQSVAEEVKPNVVLILIDDLGWQDVKCYDIDKPSPMETPNIDALAKKGIPVLAGLFTCARLCAQSCGDLEWQSSRTR